MPRGPVAFLTLGMGSAHARGAAQVDDARIVRADPAKWASYGRDYAESHCSPLARITTANVGQLRPAWSRDIPKAGARLEATPIVVDGVSYATGPYSYVFALDARTGELLWQWDPGIPWRATHHRASRRSRCPRLSRATNGEHLFPSALFWCLVDTAERVDEISRPAHTPP